MVPVCRECGFIIFVALLSSFKVNVTCVVEEAVRVVKLQNVETVAFKLPTGFICCVLSVSHKYGTSVAGSRLRVWNITYETFPIAFCALTLLEDDCKLVASFSLLVCRNLKVKVVAVRIFLSKHAHGAD